MRYYYSEEYIPPTESIRKGLDRLYRIMEEHGPFQGVIGYSEGSAMATTLLVDDERRCRATGSESSLTHAIIFAGWPPLDPDSGRPMLSDEVGKVIHSHTIHALGAADPFLHGCLSLYNLCDEKTALIFDHGKGHLVPREPKVVVELANFIRKHFSEDSCEAV